MDGRRRKRQKDSVFSQTLNSSPKRLRKMSKNVSGLTVEKVDQPALAKHDSKNLDLAFVMDCTSSMSSFILQAKNNIRKIVEEIVASEKSDVRLALVEYRDHPPQDITFVVRSNDFTESPKTMKGWLENAQAYGGGDMAEAVADGLHSLLKLSWREEATKIAVCISDAPPHGLGSSGDGFPKGCPDGIDPVEVAHQIAKKGVTLYVVGCEPSITPFKDFFMAIAHITGGQYVSLLRAEVLSKVIIGGAREEISLNQLMAEVDNEIQQRMAAGEDINEDMVSRDLHSRWTTRGECVNQLQNKSGEIETIESRPMAKKLVKLKSLGEVRANFKPAESSSSFGSAVTGAIGGMFGRWFGGGSTTAPEMEPSVTDDDYNCAETNVTYAQSSRMVYKSMAKWKK